MFDSPRTIGRALHAHLHFGTDTRLHAQQGIPLGGWLGEARHECWIEWGSWQIGFVWRGASAGFSRVWMCEAPPREVGGEVVALVVEPGGRKRRAAVIAAPVLVGHVVRAAGAAELQVVRVTERVGSAAFHQIYGQLMSESSAVRIIVQHSPAARTFRWLCVQYFASREFKSLEARTQYVRRRIFESMFDERIAPGAQETFADFPVSRLSPTALEILRDRKDGLPEAANGRVKALRAVFTWSKHKKLVQSNIANDVEYLGTSSEGWHSWEPVELEKFEQRHTAGTKARLAIDLLQYTGASRSDVVTLGHDNVRGESFGSGEPRRASRSNCRWWTNLGRLLRHAPLSGRTRFSLPSSASHSRQLDLVTGSAIVAMRPACPTSPDVLFSTDAPTIDL